jgi:hypothetical protein
MIKTIYIDTSVYGGYFDPEFDKDTIPFFEKVIENKIEIIVSDILELELYRAPAFIVDFWESLPQELIKRVKATNNKQSIVKIMREIRDKISLDIIDMSLAQENEFLKKQLSQFKNKNRGQQQAI